MGVVQQFSGYIPYMQHNVVVTVETGETSVFNFLCKHCV